MVWASSGIVQIFCVGVKHVDVQVNLSLLLRFRLSKSSIHEVVGEFMSSVVKTLRPGVQLPTSDTMGSRIPGCIGYIDGKETCILNY